MLTKDFHGNTLQEILAEISEWILAHSPENPSLIILEQGSNYYFQILCWDYIE